MYHDMTGYFRGGRIDDCEDWLRCATLAMDYNLSKLAHKGIYNDKNITKWMRVSLKVNLLLFIKRQQCIVKTSKDSTNIEHKNTQRIIQT